MSKIFTAISGEKTVSLFCREDGAYEVHWTEGKVVDEATTNTCQVYDDFITAMTFVRAKVENFLNEMIIDQLK